ncbi:MAG: hypothetical protein HY718_07020 [Planctomycetes bacterium]|nr:hypothetical protein [Planctomycetota bacterium]
MCKSCVCVVLAAALAMTPAAVFGNVYASRLEQTGPDSLSYILNEDATVGVTAQVWEVGGGMVYSENLGNLTKGTQSWTWNGTGRESGKQYTVKIVASATGYGDWTKTSVNNTQTNMYSPRGVDVNKNPAGKYFGRIYMAESVGGTTLAGRAVQDGVYMLNADGTDADGQGNTSRKGGATFGGTNSPFRLTVGPDNKVYLTDWSDSNSQLVVGDPDFNTARSVLDDSGRVASGKAANHGSIPTVHVEGSGANVTVYTMDEDFDVGADPAHGGIGSILKYEVDIDSVMAGNPHTGQPSIFYDDGAQGALKGNIMNYYDDMARGLDGTWWVSQDRSGSSTDTLASLMQVSADGTTVLWKSVPDGAANSLADPVRRTRGLAVDPVTGMLALATYNAGKVHIFDPTTKSIVTSITIASNATNRDVAWDAAGNLYIVDNNTEYLYVYSPGGANGFTTESWFTIPEPGMTLFLGLGAVLALRRRR